MTSSSEFSAWPSQNWPEWLWCEKGILGRARRRDHGMQEKGYHFGSTGHIGRARFSAGASPEIVAEQGSEAQIDQPQSFPEAGLVRPCRRSGPAESIGNGDSYHRCSRSEDPVADVPALVHRRELALSASAFRPYARIEDTGAWRRDIPVSGVDVGILVLTRPNGSQSSHGSGIRDRDVPSSLRLFPSTPAKASRSPSIFRLAKHSASAPPHFLDLRLTVCSNESRAFQGYNRRTDEA